MSRNAEGLKLALTKVREIRKEFASNVFVPGSADEFNPELEKALRVADFMEMGEIMIVDALHREESCGGHFREEYQSGEGEAERKDDEFMYVGAWEWDEKGEHILHKEELTYDNIEVKTRSYK